MTAIRHDWTREELAALFELPLLDLIHRAATVHRAHFDSREVQVSTLLSIKTGACPEDCAYCPQSAHFKTGLGVERLLPLDVVREVKKLGLETCCTLGMLKEGQAEQLRDAGLDYYNHNLDTAPELYGDVISTRDYQDRLDTLERVRNAGLSVCCGGIVGMGESRDQRAGLIAQLAAMDPPPESVPINQLVQVEGTPLAGTEALPWAEFVRTIAVARILMPTSFVRLSAGRTQMHEAVQALCFLAGANSIFYGEKLLTTGNPEVARDDALFAPLGLTAA